MKRETPGPKSRGAGCLSLLAGAVTLVLLCGANSCDTKSGDTGGGNGGNGGAAPAAGAVPTPAAAPKDWPVGDQEFWGMAITVWVEAECLPFYVTADVTDATTGEHINLISTDTELGMKVTYQYWSVPVAYPAHHDIKVVVHVRASKPSQRGYITIREGERPYTKSTDFNGTAAAALPYDNQRS